MKVLVTGGAGFIGSNLADRLLDLKHNVIVYDDFSIGRHEFLRDNIRLAEGSILDTEKLANAMQDCDLVFHLAALSVVYGAASPQPFIQQNILGTASVLSAMEKAGVRKIAFASSQAVYGEHEEPVSESAVSKPISYYGATKLAGEALIAAHCKLNNAKAWLFRLANTVGRRQTHGVIFDFIKKLEKDKNKLQILGDGTQRKSYLLIDECIDAMLLATEKANESVNLFNVGTPEAIDVKTIAEIVASELGLQPELAFEDKKEGWPGDQTEIFLNTGKINSLGWHSRHSQAETIRLAVRQILERD